MDHNHNYDNYVDWSIGLFISLKIVWTLPNTLGIQRIRSGSWRMVYICSSSLQTFLKAEKKLICHSLYSLGMHFVLESSCRFAKPSGFVLLSWKKKIDVFFKISFKSVKFLLHSHIIYFFNQHSKIISISTLYCV